MRRLTRIGIAVFAALVLAAEFDGCSTPAPTRQPDVAGTVCLETRAQLHDPGRVSVQIENDPALPAFVLAFVYAPHAISAKVGQAIVFTNLDPDVQHTAELDSGDCGTDYLSGDASDGLVFKQPGQYPIHCLVHGDLMTGTITITR